MKKGKRSDKIKITSCSSYLTETRGIKVGDVFPVITTGISENKSRKQPNFYLVEVDNKPIVIYFDEAELITKSR